MKATVYLPQDSGALSLGAEAVASAVRQEAKKRGQELQLIRTGSRGMYWLEPSTRGCNRQWTRCLRTRRIL